MKTSELKKHFYMYGNKGACWSNEIHIAPSGSNKTLCGSYMLASNWAMIWEKDEIGCESCLNEYNKINEKVAVAVIDRSVSSLFVYDVPEYITRDESLLDDYLTKNGRKTSQCSWGVFDGNIEDLRHD